MWNLGFDEKPNYEFYREIFRDLIRKESKEGEEYSEEIFEEEIPRDTVQLVRNWKYRDWGLKEEGTIDKDLWGKIEEADDEIDIEDEIEE